MSWRTSCPPPVNPDSPRSATRSVTGSSGVLGAFAAWQGWNYWQREQAVKAGALYDEIDKAAQAGEIDRAALRRLVFADAAARSRLEAALHPLIGAEAGRRIEQWSGPYGLIVVPLLLERRGVRSIVDRVLVVDCPEEEQVRRVVARNALSPAEVHAIMATQLDRRQRLVAADDILDNTGTPDAIAPQVLVLDARYRRLAAAGSD